MSGASAVRLIARVPSRAQAARGRRRASSHEPEQLAIAVLALSNGVAIEHLADPENVDPSLFGVILSLLLDGLLPASGSDGGSDPAG